MENNELIDHWFEKWEKGDIDNLPISDNFSHTSPFGTIEGKKTYLNLVRKNMDKFLGHRFEIHDRLVSGDKACVRYTAIQNNFSLDVSEWYYFSEGKISKIFAYYHIGEIIEDRQLSK